MTVTTSEMPKGVEHNHTYTCTGCAAPLTDLFVGFAHPGESHDLYCIRCGPAVWLEAHGAVLIATTRPCAVCGGKPPYLMAWRLPVLPSSYCTPCAMREVRAQEEQRTPVAQQGADA